MTVSVRIIEHDADRSFKQSDLGMIPYDWKIVKIEEVCQIINGRGFKPHEWHARGVPIIRIKNLNGSMEFNFYYGYYDRKIEIKSGQLLFAWSGSRGTSFGPHIWKGPLGVLNYHTWKMVVNEAAVSPSFLFYALDGLTQFIEGQAHGASGLVHVQKWQMEGFKLVIPESIGEQEAIAEALSDADTLIASLEALVTKKRAIKQGAMRDLLSGRKRLPGFGGEWKTKELGELGSFFKGSGVRKDEAQSGALPCVRYGEIYTTHHDIVREFKSFISREVAATAAEIRTGDILFACSGETKKEIGKSVAIVNFEKAYAGGDIVVLRPAQCDARYLGYALNRHDVQRQKSAKGQGDAVVHISTSALAEISITLPSLNEQTAIGDILDQMDGEIALLERKLAKARQIKQGMMQELLSGRVRLV